MSTSPTIAWHDSRECASTPHARSSTSSSSSLASARDENPRLTITWHVVQAPTFPQACSMSILLSSNASQMLVPVAMFISAPAGASSGWGNIVTLAMCTLPATRSRLSIPTEQALRDSRAMRFPPDRCARHCARGFAQAGRRISRRSCRTPGTVCNTRGRGEGVWVGAARFRLKHKRPPGSREVTVDIPTMARSSRKLILKDRGPRRPPSRSARRLWFNDNRLRYNPARVTILDLYVRMRAGRAATRVHCVHCLCHFPFRCIHTTPPFPFRNMPPSTRFCVSAQ